MMELARILPNDYYISTEGDLALIDILYQQDVDLGVGKEVFDPSMREELEKEREIEYVKQQERQKAQLLAKEKKEREKRELKDQWLRSNFMRDGETGEWIQLQNGTAGNTSDLMFPSVVDAGEKAQASFSLEDALDFLGNLEKAQGDFDADACSSFTYEPVEEFNVSTQPHEQLQQSIIEHQDSFDQNWNGLVDYLNMTANSDDSLMNNESTLFQLCDELSKPVDAVSDHEPRQDLDLQTDYLTLNTAMTSPSMDVTADINALTPMEEFDPSVPVQPTNNSLLNFDLGDFNLFNNLTTTTSDSIVFDLDEVSDLFGSIQNTGSDNLDKSLNLVAGVDSNQMFDNSLTIPASSNANASPYHDFGEQFDALEGAVGGSNYGNKYGDMSDHFSKASHLSESSCDSGFVGNGAFSRPSSVSSSYAGSPAGSHNGLNSSASGNDTEHDSNGAGSVVKHQVAHNHTYNTPPGQVPREVKKYSQKEPSRKGPHSRDHRRAEELKIPFSVEEIIASPVEKFNEILTKHKLNEAQLALIRDIRRRGKNKVAAQNCRKRKVSVIFSLSDEMTELQKMRDRLTAERAAMDRERQQMKEKCGHLYTHIFQSLRDEHGDPYDPNMYSLQQSSDGNVFLVPRNLTVNKNSNSSSPSSQDSFDSKKHRSFDH